MLANLHQHCSINMTNIIQYIIIGIQYINFLKKQFYNHYDQKNSWIQTRKIFISAPANLGSMHFVLSQKRTWSISVVILYH